MFSPETIGKIDCSSDLIPEGSSAGKWMRKLLVSMLMIAVVSLAFASKGGGGEKKAKDTPLKTNFTPIRTTTNFTLKVGPTFTGSYFVSTERKKDYVSFKTLITYEKGNSTYIMPYHYRINTSVYMNNSGNNNLRLLDLRINMSNH